MHRILTLRTITPLHVGSGQSVGTTDLPVAREKATDWPVVPGSSVKGVLKDTARVDWLDAEKKFDKRSKEAGDEADMHLAYLFGSPKSDDASAGALAVTDLRCLLFPVRSLAGTFAYVTCPLAIQRANALLAVAGKDPIPEIEVPDESVWLPNGSKLRHSAGAERVYLEDLDLKIAASSADPAPAIARLAGIPPNQLAKRLAVLTDDLFTFLAKNATEVITHVSLEFETRTARGGFLRSEERVPAEAVFIGLAAVDDLHASGAPERVQNALNKFDGRYCQFGGKASVGNGLCLVGMR